MKMSKIEELKKLAKDHDDLKKIISFLSTERDSRRSFLFPVWQIMTLDEEVIKKLVEFFISVKYQIEKEIEKA